MLERFDEFRCPFISFVRELGRLFLALGFWRGGCDDKEGRAFEKDDLRRAARLRELGEMGRQNIRVGYEGMHDIRPGLVQTFVIDTCAQHLDGQVSTGLLQLLPLCFESRFLQIVSAYEVHLVHEKEDSGFRTELSESLQTVAIVVQVFGHLAALHVKNVDEHANVLKDGGPLGGKIAVHEGILSTAVPKVEDEVAQESNMVLLDVDGGAQAGSEGGGVVRKND